MTPTDEYTPRDLQAGYGPRGPWFELYMAGQGRVAEQILAAAREHHIPVHEDPGLAAALATVELDTAIPPELYAVVAEVLAYVYRLQKRSLRQG